MSNAAAGVPRTLLWLLASLIGFAPLAIDMYLPALPAIATDLSASAADVQATLAAYLAGMAMGQLGYGVLADRWGRRRPLLLGLGLFTVASLGCAQADSVTSLIAWRWVQALGGCAGVVMALVIVADRVHGPAALGQVMSRLMAVIGLAPVLAPVLGNAVLLATGWRGIFVLLAVLAATASVLVWRTLEETLPAEARAARPVGWGTALARQFGLLKVRRFAAPAFTGPLAGAGMFVYIGASAFVLIGHHGLSPGQFSAVFAGNALLMTLTSQLNARLLRRLSPQQILRFALPALVLCGLALAGLGALRPDALTPLLIALALYLGLLGLVSGNASALALSGHPATLRGAASGLMGTLQFACGALAGAALSAAGPAAQSALGMGLAMAVCACLAWAALACTPAD